MATTHERVAPAARAGAGLTAELAAAIAALTDPAGWRSMLEVSARFRRYHLNNQLLLWAQACQLGMSLTRVRLRHWPELGYRVWAGETGPRIFGPVPAATGGRGGLLGRRGPGSVRR
jgi:hypothetical protein